MNGHWLPVWVWDDMARGLVLSGAALIAWVLLRYAAAAFDRYRETFVVTASANLHALFLFVDPARVFVAHMALIAAAAGVAAFVVQSWIAALPAGLAAWALPAFAYRNLARRRLQRLERQLPDALGTLAGSLRAGASFNVALERLIEEQAPPLSQEFELLLREQRLGVDSDLALQRLAQRVPLADFHIMVAAIRISRETGGNLAGVLEALVDTLRRKAMMESKVAALTAQGRMQGVVMSLLPVGLGAVLYVMEPDMMRPLFTTTVGWLVLGGCAVMELLGYFAIRRITTIDV